MSRKLTIWLFLATIFSSYSQTIDYKYQIMFINNFAKNIEWPAEAPSGDFVIAVADNSKVADEMSNYFSTKTINNRKATVKKVSSSDPILDCHILFVPISNKNNISQIVGKLGNKPTLLITEKEGWGKQGSVINFIISDEGKMKFELNKDAAQKRSLKIPGSLVNLAIVI